MAAIFNFPAEGTAGTTVTTANSGFTTVSAGTGGTLTYETDSPAVGTAYVKNTVGTTATSSNMTYTTTARTYIGGRIRFRVQAVGGSSGTQVMSVRTGGTYQLVLLMATGKLRIHNGSATIATSTNNYSIGSWVELRFVVGNGRFVCTMVLPDGTTETLSGTGLSGTVDSFRIGIQPSTSSYRIDYDDVWIDSGVALGSDSNGSGQSFTGSHGTSRAAGTNSNGSGQSFTSSVGRRSGFLVSQGQGAAFAAQKGAQSVLAVSEGFGAAYSVAKSAVGVLLGAVSNGVNVTGWTGKKGTSRTFGESNGVTLGLISSRSAARQFAVSNGAGLTFTASHGTARSFTVQNGAALAFVKRHGGSRTFLVSDGQGAAFVTRRGANRSFVLVAGIDVSSVTTIRPHLVAFHLSEGYVIMLTSVLGGHGFYDDNLHIGPPAGRSPRVSIAQHWRVGPPSIGSINASL